MVGLRLLLSCSLLWAVIVSLQATSRIPGSRCNSRQCGLGEGNCEGNWQCRKGLVCGRNNCNGTQYGPEDNCCVRPAPGHHEYCSAEFYLCDEGEGDCSRKSEKDCKPGLVCGDDNCMGDYDTYDCCKIADISAPKWKSVKIYLGQLPKETKLKKFVVPEPISKYAIELLLYVEVMNNIKYPENNKRPNMSYRLFTEDKDAKYNKYVPASFSNAANIWLPYTSQRQIHVQATGFSSPLGEKNSFQADIYLIGFRNTWR